MKNRVMHGGGCRGGQHMKNRVIHGGGCKGGQHLKDKDMQVQKGISTRTLYLEEKDN